MKRARRDLRQGQVLLIAAFAVVVMAGVAALAIDVGHMYHTRARLQNASDAACLAAAHELLAERGAGATEADARAAATAEAASIVTENAGSARTEVEYGEMVDGQFAARDVATAATAVRACALRDESSPGGALATFFAAGAGMSAVEVTADATAEMITGVYGIGNDLRPFGVPANALEEVGPGETFTFNLEQGTWEPLDGYEDEISPGNFGWLNLDGGAQSTTELVDWITNGYPDLFTIDPETGYIILDGTCGVRASLQDELTDQIGNKLFVCVYDQVTGAGANAEFRIVTFACVTILEVNLTGSPKYIRMQFETLSNVPIVKVGYGSPFNNLCTIKLVQ